MALYCPSCGERLSPVSRRDDYFCRACHGALVVLDGFFALWQEELHEEQTLVSVETLRTPTGADAGIW